jgi:hypothetical protein
MLSVLLALSAFTHPVPQDAKPDFVAQGTFDSDWAKLKSLGVCRISAEDIGCWDMDGRYDTGLRDRAQVLVQSYSSEFQFSYGKKNRYLAVEVASSSISFKGRDGNYAQEITIHRSYREPRLSLIRVAFPPDQTTGSLLAEAHSVNEGSPMRVQFKEGQKSQFDGWSIEVGGSKPAPDAPGGPDGSYGGPGKRWFIFVSSYFEPGAVPYRIAVNMLDMQSRSIRYVDQKGNPVSDAAYAKEMAGSQEPDYIQRQSRGKVKPPKYAQVFMLTGQT